MCYLLQTLSTIMLDFLFVLILDSGLVLNISWSFILLILLTALVLVYWSWFLGHGVLVMMLIRVMIMVVIIAFHIFWSYFLAGHGPGNLWLWLWSWWFLWWSWSWSWILTNWHLHIVEKRSLKIASTFQSKLELQFGLKTLLKYSHLCIDPVTVHATSHHSFRYNG